MWSAATAPSGSLREPTRARAGQPQRIARAAAVVAELDPLKGQASVEKIAANAVMAGCEPEHRPGVLAAVAAIAEPEFNLRGVQTTDENVAPLIIVSGPVARDLDINSGFGALGPGWRANAAIGRALRMVMNNIGGGWPGAVSFAGLGQPARYTLCPAETAAPRPAPAGRRASLRSCTGARVPRPRSASGAGQPASRHPRVIPIARLRPLEVMDRAVAHDLQEGPASGFAAAHGVQLLHGPADRAAARNEMLRGIETGGFKALARSRHEPFGCDIDPLSGNVGSGREAPHTVRVQADQLLGAEPTQIQGALQWCNPLCALHEDLHLLLQVGQATRELETRPGGQATILFTLHPHVGPYLTQSEQHPLGPLLPGPEANAQTSAGKIHSTSRQPHVR